MIYISLGTNIGDRDANLSDAIERLRSEKVDVRRASSCYETAPQDVLDQPWFLNLVIECQTQLLPIPLMARLLHIEREMGRDRSANATRRGPRLIDIDILLYNDAVLESPRLTVPHPRLLERRFVLEPLLELAPELQDPRTNQPLAQALSLVRDQKLIRH
jgi:2-amino-4-hydroxy-6-hydroxymethyldihydropteridine diphosphokinase